jgi:hypothetical protein
VLLELVPHRPERIADGSVEMLMRGVPFGRAFRDEVRSWNRHLDLDPPEAALPLMVVGQLDGDMAADEARKDLLEVRHPGSHVVLDGFAGWSPVKPDLEGCLHDCHQCSRRASVGSRTCGPSAAGAPEHRPRACVIFLSSPCLIFTRSGHNRPNRVHVAL